MFSRCAITSRTEPEVPLWQQPITVAHRVSAQFYEVRELRREVLLKFEELASRWQLKSPEIRLQLVRMDLPDWEEGLHRHDPLNFFSFRLLNRSETICTLGFPLEAILGSFRPVLELLLFFCEVCFGRIAKSGIAQHQRTESFPPSPA